ncbi:uncharacterized protein LOC125680345 isoform X2 [Ostrea edulis]|uniref:uncharacterized protein LOC125680345 isoform X2 n=1 Tax=Ostrea edulis TaxID=37623 RepID=UPI0024AF289D|nr:uncharacterized protein LOC125680345 isoform X2 [Ostrea edulis]
MLGASTQVHVLTLADPRVARYQVEKWETGKYLAQTNAGDSYLCHYCVMIGNVSPDISDQCDLQNEKRSFTERKENLYPWCYPGSGSPYPACPPLPTLNNGYWICPPGITPDAVEAYAACAARCLEGYHLKEEIVVRCPESLNWTHSVTPHCSSDGHSCQLYNLSFITHTPHQVIVSWNATSDCKPRDIVFVMSGPRQNFTKNLTEKTSFLVFKNIDLDTVYRVTLFIDQEEIISGKFRSAAGGIPQKPHHIQVDILNTSAVNVSWVEPRNNTKIIGYMVQMLCDDNTLTLNTSVNVLIINELKVSKNYTITVIAFNQHKASLQSDPVYVKLPELKPRESNDATKIEWYLILIIIVGLAVTLCVVGVSLRIRHRKRNGRGREGRNNAASNQEQLPITSLTVNVNSNPVYDQSDKLLVRKSENPSGESIGSQEFINVPILDPESLEIPGDSLGLSEAANLNMGSLNQCGESQDSSDISDFDSSNAEFSSFLEEIDKNQPKSKSQSGKKTVPGSDSGRGSVTETISTVSSSGSKCRSSQSNSPTGCDKVISQDSFRQQISNDSGREADTRDGVESNDKLPQDWEVKINMEFCESTRADMPLKAEPYLTNISEKSNEEDNSEKISRPDAQDPEACSCTFQAFTDSPNSYQHLKDLGDFLDPDNYYGHEKSWKGFTEAVLQMEKFRIPAIDKRCSNGSPFQTEVLEKLKAEGKKIGHLVFYFSQKEHLRLDVLDKISEFHQGCKFCDKIFAQLNENR